MGHRMSYLSAFSISDESCHDSIQLTELTQGGTDVFVKLFVLLILIIEHSFVLFPFFHTADLWVLPAATDKTAKLSNRHSNGQSCRCLQIVGSHDIVCNDVHFGDAARRRGFVLTVGASLEVRGEHLLLVLTFVSSRVAFSLE